MTRKGAAVVPMQNLRQQIYRTADDAWYCRQIGNITASMNSSYGRKYGTCVSRPNEISTDSGLHTVATPSSPSFCVGLLLLWLLSIPHSVYAAPPAAKTVSKQTWLKVPGSIALPPCDSSPNAVVVKNGSVFVLSGWQHTTGQWESLSEVWCSPDGGNWSLQNSHPPYPPYSAFVLFHGYMWALSSKAYRSKDGRLWERVSSDLPFDTATRAVVFRDSLWVLSQERLWRSYDGIAWELIQGNGLWGARGWPGFVAFRDKLWIIGGSNNSEPQTCFADVWSSADGANWRQILAQAPWSPRLWATITTHQDRIWMLGGRLQGEITEANDFGNCNEVWTTTDGHRWQKEVAISKWSPRHGVLSWSSHGRLWVACGYDGRDTAGLFNDIWYLP